MKHTPGPWRITVGAYWLRIVGPIGQAIASFGNQRRWMDDREVEANVYLIAASPELLAACEAVARAEPEWDAADFIEQVQAAIAKATGGQP